MTPKNLLPALLLLGLCASAQAELIKVFENIRGTVVYADSGMLSMKLLKEYNCNTETAQIVSYSMYTERMAKGSLIGQVNTPGPVDKLTKNPGGAGGWRYACGK
jgi:hypothetical protein